MEVARSTITQAQLDSYSNTIELLYNTYPHLIESRYWFDTDETPLPAGGREEKVVTVAGVAPNKVTSPNDKLAITVLPCICADGTQAPPLLVVPGELLTIPGWWGVIHKLLRGGPLERATCVSQVRRAVAAFTFCDGNFPNTASKRAPSFAGERLHVQPDLARLV